jgi:hypothetical protein
MDAIAGGRAFDPSVISEASMYFAEVIGRTSGHERAMLEIHFNVIRQRAGLSPCSPRRRQSPAKAGHNHHPATTGHKVAPNESNNDQKET